MAKENIVSSSKTTLQDAIEANLKSVTLYRFILAFLVFASHSYPIFLGRPDPQIPFFWRTSVSLGTFAVGGFFALSGLLLYSSTRKLPPRIWIIRRSLRLLPAYVTCLLFCSFVLSPIATYLESGNLDSFFNFSLIGPFAYAWNNFFMPVGVTYALNNTFSNTPYGALTGGASVVNGSIWSLPYEIRCYLVLAIIRYLLTCKHRDKLLPIFACITFAGYLFSGTTQFQRVSAPLWLFSDPLFLQLLSIFLFGACFGIYSRKIHLNYLTLTAVFAFYFASSYHSKILSTVGITMTLIVPFALGQLKFKKFEGGRFFIWDVSYGFYLYSFPLQQMTVLLLPQMSFSGLFMVGLIVTLFFSILSYRMVEAPGINLGKTFKAQTRIES